MSRLARTPFAYWGACAIFCAVSCTPKTDAPPTSGADGTATAPSPAQLISRGKAVYMSACIACHNVDPKKTGGLGPEVYGATMELLEARVVHGTYQPGYTPKRNTKTMQALPQLQAELRAIHAFLNSEEKN